MSAPLTELTFESVLRDGLGELKLNPNRLDDIFGKFLEAQFLNQYGQSKIEEIKTYITNNQIKLVHSFQQVPTNVPCFSIQLMRADETEDLQVFGNDYLELDTTTAPNIIAPTVLPGTFDILTNKLTVTNVVDLSSVCPGMIFKDASNTEFEIKSPISNLSGDKYITIISNGNTPNMLNPGSIVSSIKFKRTDRRHIKIRETIMLGVHASNDIHLTKFLYYILVYILKSRQDSLINRGIQLDRGTGNIFDRLDEFQGENIFSRMLEVNCMTEFVWNQSEVQVFDCFDVTIKTPSPNSTSTNSTPYNTSG